MGEAPYLVIAAELRRQIADGELRPGERVPSTRALVRDFGVAMATATRALQTLQQERLVHPSPGVGTVVGPPPRVRRTPGRGTPELNRAEVVRAAITIADAEGLAVVSMRRLATDLGVSTMALYRYVGGKDALVAQMVDLAMGEVPLPEQSGDWRETVTAIARLHWAAYRKHLWLAGALNLSRPQLTPRLLPHTDAVLRAVSRLGRAEALTTVITLFAFVRGMATVMESEAQAEQDTGMTADEWIVDRGDQFTALATAANLTAFRELVAGDFDYTYDVDHLFESGLAVLLDGLATRLR